MKKLNKSELEALANKIQSDMKKANDEFIKKELLANKNLSLARRDIILYELNNMHQQLKDYVTSKMSYSSKDYMKEKEILKYVEQQMVEELKLPYAIKDRYEASQKIQQELILAQIEASDLKGLVDIVKSGYEN